MKKAIALLLTFIVALCTACAGEPTVEEFYNSFKKQAQGFSKDSRAYSQAITEKNYGTAKVYAMKAKTDIDEIVNLKYPSKYKTLFEDMVTESKREKEYIDIVLKFCDYASRSDSLSEAEVKEFDRTVRNMDEYLDSFEDKSFPKAIVSLTVEVKKDANVGEDEY